MKMQSRVLMVAAAVAGVVLIVVSAESGPPATPTSPDATAAAAGPVDPNAPLPPDHPPLDGATGQAPAGGGTIMTGVIQEVIPASRYVYLRIEDLAGSGEPLWIATAAVEVEEGDQITFNDGTLMTDFYSQSLDRTFDRILFVTAVQPVS